MATRLARVLSIGNFRHGLGRRGRFPNFTIVVLFLCERLDRLIQIRMFIDHVRTHLLYDRLKHNDTCGSSRPVFHPDQGPPNLLNGF